MKHPLSFVPEKNLIRSQGRFLAVSDLGRWTRRDLTNVFQNEVIRKKNLSEILAEPLPFFEYHYDLYFFDVIFFYCNQFFYGKQ